TGEQNRPALAMSAARPPVNGWPDARQSRLKAAGPPRPIMRPQPALAGFASQQAPRLRGETDAVSGAPRFSVRAGGLRAVPAAVSTDGRRDDFVLVPSPRIAAEGAGATRAAAEAVAAYKRETAVVDPRLVHNVTLGLKATALSDLCEKLRADTGIQLA